MTTCAAPRGDPGADVPLPAVVQGIHRARLPARLRPLLRRRAARTLRALQDDGLVELDRGLDHTSPRVGRLLVRSVCMVFDRYLAAAQQRAQYSRVIVMSGLAAAAFVAGLLGGVHCIGMCGGIVGTLALEARGSALARQLAYNAGRIGRLRARRNVRRPRRQPGARGRRVAVRAARDVLRGQRGHGAPGTLRGGLGPRGAARGGRRIAALAAHRAAARGACCRSIPPPRRSAPGSRGAGFPAASSTACWCSRRRAAAPPVAPS